MLCLPIYFLLLINLCYLLFACYLYPRRNMGAFSYVEPRIKTATDQLNKNKRQVRYVGRKVSAAPATGMGKIHQEEYQTILDEVFGAELEEYVE